jgi:tRNA(fMet)-specific endonuclease VapC
VGTLLDTSVAVGLRDLDPDIKRRVAAFELPPMISVITMVELKGRSADATSAGLHRRRLLEEMLGILKVVPFGLVEAEIYGSIVAALGFARNLVIDRMIAAQAIAIGATLATLNPKDFRTIPGLALEDWTLPPS